MKRRHYISVLALALTLTSSLASTARADNVLDSPVAYSFVQALSQYYGIPQREVVVVHDRGIPEEELPLVFTVARHVHVQPVEVVELRHEGLSWNDIFGRYHLSPTILAVPDVPESVGPPYGRAYGYWRHHPHSTVVYSDEDYVNFGNVYFLHRYHHAPAREIIRLRETHPSFLVVHDTYRHRTGHHRDRGQPIVVTRVREHGHHGDHHANRNNHDHHDRGDHEHGHGRGHDHGHGRGHGHH